MFTNATFIFQTTCFPSLFHHALYPNTTGIPPSNRNLLERNVKSKPEYVKILLVLGTDQGLLNDVYGNSWRTVSNRRLPYTYNMAYSTFKIYRSAHNRYDIRLYVTTFVPQQVQHFVTSFSVTINQTCLLPTTLSTSVFCVCVCFFRLL